MIIEGPGNSTVPVGAIATFHCIARGVRAFWKINNTEIVGQGIAIFIAKGFTFNERFVDSTINLTIMVNALAGINNTKIVCLVLPAGDYFLGSLTVIGTSPGMSSLRGELGKVIRLFVISLIISLVQKPM